jgi:hypothetical protein
MAKNMMIVDDYTHSYEMGLSEKWRIDSIKWKGWNGVPNFQTNPSGL